MLQTTPHFHKILKPKEIPKFSLIHINFFVYLCSQKPTPSLQPKQSQWGEEFFIFPLFPSSSQWVSIRFPMCSPRVFPISPHFNPICFAQSLLTYISGPKGEALHLFIEFSTLGSLESFGFSFFFVMGQSNWLIGEIKSWTWEALHRKCKVQKQKQEDKPETSWGRARLCFLAPCLKPSPSWNWNQI